jgi:hypothetical protein
MGILKSFEQVSVCWSCRDSAVVLVLGHLLRTVSMMNLWREVLLELRIEQLATHLTYQ